MRATGQTPAAMLTADRAAMAGLPPVAPRVGWHGQVRLGRDYYVRVAGNDYSVDPTVIGGMVELTCILERVQARCAGVLVADHERSWARARNVTDPAHVATAKGLREAFQTRQRATGPPAVPRAGDVVARRALTDYDTAFGLTPATPTADTPAPARTLTLVRP